MMVIILIISTNVMCYVYLVTELNEITDNVTKIQRQKSSTKFYNLINQNTVISNKIKIQILTWIYTKLFLLLLYRRTKYLVSKWNPEILKSSVDRDIEIRLNLLRLYNTYQIVTIPFIANSSFNLFPHNPDF